MSKIKILFSILVCGALMSCVKEEPLNAECDIEQIWFHLDEPTATFFTAADTTKAVSSTEDNVTFHVRRNHQSDLTALIPHLALTPGARASLRQNTVDAVSGGNITYRITSEDGLWHRDYTISIVPLLRTIAETVSYDFEHFELEKKKQQYYIWTCATKEEAAISKWTNGNEGFAMARPSAKPEEFPSVPLIDGYDGHGLKLTTRSTGFFGSFAKKPIAAGNFYLGEFDFGKAVSAPMQATKFGIPFDRQPISITGYYKYKPGKKVIDKNSKAIPGKTDEPAIYAVFYRNTDANGNHVTLYGDDVKTNANIVAIANVGKLPATNQWTAFKLTFDYKEPLDYTLLDNRGYNLTIVFSSSQNGDSFEGAVGSELCIDKVRVICKKEEEVTKAVSNKKN